MAYHRAGHAAPGCSGCGPWSSSTPPASPTGVLVAPVLPGLSDGPEQLDAVVRACVDAGARSISSVLLHLRPGVKEVFLGRLAETHPHLLASYRRRYRDRAYAPKAEQQALETRVRELVRRYGGLPAERSDPRHHTGHDPAPGSATETRPSSGSSDTVLAGGWEAPGAAVAATSGRSDSGGFLEDVDAAGGAEADDVGESDLGVGDLAVAGFVAEVVADLPDVGDAGGGDGVALGLEAAGHVDRGRAVAPGGPGLEERHRFALAPQSIRLS